MFARVTRFEMDVNRQEEASRIADTQISPGLRQEPGFKHMYALVDRQTGSGMVVTVWDSQADEEASRKKAGQYFAKLGDVLTAPPQRSEVYDVVGNA